MKKDVKRLEPLGYPPPKKSKIVLGVAEQKFSLHLRDFNQGYLMLLR